MEIKFITEGMACSKCEARVTERLDARRLLGRRHRF